LQQLARHRLLAAQAPPLGLWLVLPPFVDSAVTDVIGTGHATVVATATTLRAQRSTFEADFGAKSITASFNAVIP
jgi:hypothetical protein